MVISSIDNSFEKLVELAKQLENKDIIRLFKALFPKLKSNKLQYLADILEVAIAEAVESENDDLENTAKFLYKVVKSNNYVTLRVWGREECNEYLGPMPFLPGITYELTHLRTGETKTLVGHMLYRRQNQIYMVVEQLTPVYQMLEYLYYDRDSEFPRRPQDICIKKIFSRKDWNIEKLKNVSDANTPVKNESTDFSILKQTLKPVSLMDSDLQTSGRTRTSNFLVESNRIKNPLNSKLSSASKSARQQAALTVVPVNKIFSSQVKITMEQWVKARQEQQQRRTKAHKIEGQKYEYGEKEMEIIPGLLAKVHN